MLFEARKSSENELGIWAEEVLHEERKVEPCRAADELQEGTMRRTLGQERKLHWRPAGVDSIWEAMERNEKSRTGR